MSDEKLDGDLRSQDIVGPALTREGKTVTIPDGYLTQEDVALLSQPWHHDDCGALWALYDHDCQCHDHPTRKALASLASRISALLPPEEG